MPLTYAIEEMIHGILVRDPYRWLEDRSRPETCDWIHVQQQRCEKYFAEDPDMGALEARVRQYLDVEVVDQPACVRDHYFYRKRAVGQEQGSICVRAISGGNERILVDPTGSRPFASVGIFRIASDAALLAYELKQDGGDRKEICFISVESGTILPNTIPLGYARGLTFCRDGYYFCQEIDQSATEHSICYQPFGSPDQASIVFRVPRTRDSRLILRANECWLGALWLRQEGTDVVTDFWTRDLHDKPAEWFHVCQERRGRSSPVLWRERILILVETPSGSSKLVELSHKGEDLGTFVPEKNFPIQQIGLTCDRIFVSYAEPGGTTIDAWDYCGQQTPSVILPQGGTVRMLPSPAPDADYLFYSFESFDSPLAIYMHDPRANKSVLWHQRGPVDRKRRRLVQETSVFSKDGEQIPLTLVSADSNRIRAGHRAVIMTSYGGFGVATTPQFCVLADILMEYGAIFALPHVRGGGEFGKRWHDAGRARNRQTSFDDFIAAAGWLCGEGITSPDQLGIFGGSNAGLLIAAVITQRPDLFGAAVCIAPLLDMVRYEFFDQAVRWRKEFGTAADADDFRALFAYSPYHQVAEDSNYPAVLFVTGDEDDRCNPAHVRKMAALLQDRLAQKSPVIVDYCRERGHSPVLPLSIRIRALSRRIAFLCRELGINESEGDLYEKSDL